MPELATATPPAAPAPVPMTKAVLAELIGAEVAKAVAPLNQTIETLRSSGGTNRAKELLGGNNVTITIAGEEEKKGHMAAKYIRACGRALWSKKKTGSERPPSFSAAELYGEQHPVTLAMADMEKKAISITTVEGGAAVIPDIFTMDIIDFLRPMSIYDSLGPISVPLINGKMEIPKLTAGASAFWVGSDAAIPVTKQAFGILESNAKKIGCVLPMSNDWLRYTAPGYDQMLIDDLVAALSQKRDITLIRSDGTQSEPKGFRYWAPSGNVFNAQAGSSLTAMNADLGALRLKLVKGLSRMIRPAIIMGPTAEEALMSVLTANGIYAFRDEMVLRGTIRGIPYKRSNQIPENLGTGLGSEVYLVDMADVVYGYGTNLMVDMSSEASYTDGGTTVSSFQMDQTIVRVLLECTQVVRHAESVAVLNNVYWSPS